MSNQNDSYDIYIGNLSVTTSRERLKILFSEIGEILSIWINQKHPKFTFAFIRFCHLIDAKKACEQFNNKDLDGNVIKVSISLRTQQKLTNCVRKKDDSIELPKRTDPTQQKLTSYVQIRDSSILLELPKRTGPKIPTKQDKIREILKNDLVKTNSNEFVKDFVNALIETDDIVCSNQFHIIKTEPEKSDLKDLDNTIKRFFNKSSKANSLFEVDFDLSKNNVITTEQYEKFFVLNNNTSTATATANNNNNNNNNRK